MHSNIVSPKKGELQITGTFFIHVVRPFMKQQKKETIVMSCNIAIWGAEYIARK